MTHHIILSVAIAVSKMELEEICAFGGSNIAHGKRTLQDDVADRLPDVQEGNSARQQVLGVVRQKLTQSRGARFGRVVAMHEHDRRSLRGVLLVCQRLRSIGLGADCVIKDQHPLGASCLLEKVDNLGVEGCSHSVVILPFVVSGLEFMKGETLFVNRKGLRAVPSIGHGHLIWSITRFVNVFCSIAFVKIDFSESVDIFGIIESRMNLAWGALLI